jgi:hypothetical protein
MESEIGKQVVCGNCQHWRAEDRPGATHGKCHDPSPHRLSRTYLLDWCSSHDATPELRARLEAEAAARLTRTEARAAARAIREAAE